MNKRIQIITGATVFALATPFLGFDLTARSAGPIVDQCINQQNGRQLNTDFCNCLNLQGRWIVPDQVKGQTDEVLGGTSKAFCEMGVIGEDGSGGPSETGSVIPGGGDPPPVVVDDGGGVAKGNNGKGQQVADGPPPGIGNSTNDETAPGQAGSEPILPPGQKKKQ